MFVVPNNILALKRINVLRLFITTNRPKLAICKTRNIGTSIYTTNRDDLCLTCMQHVYLACVNIDFDLIIKFGNLKL